jgi:hypothetical protein
VTILGLAALDRDEARAQAGGQLAWPAAADRELAVVACHPADRVTTAAVPQAKHLDQPAARRRRPPLADAVALLADLEAFLAARA